MGLRGRAKGERPPPQKAPLKRIFFLSKAQDNTVKAMESKESLHRPVTQCFPAILDKASVAFVMEFCGKLASNIPCYGFGFVPDETAVEFIEEAANRGFF